MKFGKCMTKPRTRTEGTFVCACVRAKKRGVHESRDFHGILKSIRGGKFKVHFVNKLYSITTTSIWI